MSNSRLYNHHETIYTDDRFPGLQIRHSGGSIFNIWIEGELPGYHHENGWSNTDCFTHYPREETPENQGFQVEPNEAADIVAEHFDDMEG